MPKLSAENLSFEAPQKNPCDVLVIAGEHSGDQQAARMLKSAFGLKSDLNVCAFAGAALKGAGAQLLFDMTGFSVVGFFEVLRNYKFFKILADRIADWIDTHRPKIVCLVDYPGFNLHLAQLLKERGISRKGGGNVSVIYYISPQIWAWKAGRRFKMEDVLDSLAVIFPFEPKCYADTSLQTTFVGHPFLEEGHKQPLEYDESADILFLPGSRNAAVGRIFPLMLKALLLCPKERVTVPYPSAPIRERLEKILKRFPALQDRVKLVKDNPEKPLKAKAALMSSGTMSLNCALAAIPSAIVYKANIFTYLVARPIVNISYLGISNILLDGSSSPEYIQFAARPKTLAKRLSYCAENPQARKEALQDAEKLREILSAPSEVNAARWLVDNLKNSQ